MTNLSPETALLLACASPAPDAAAITSLLKSELDWDQLTLLAESHRLLPLLYWRVHSISPESVQPPLADSFRENLKNSLLLTRELATVTSLLASRGISVIPYKGPALALTAYRNLALRSFFDLDLLLRRQDVWPAEAILREAGYRGKIDIDDARRESYQDSYDELVMYGPDGTTIIELHWWFVPPHFGPDLDFERCAPRLGTVLVGNRTLPTLHPDDLLFVLSVHAAKHCWSHLGMITDFAWLLDSNQFDWAAILQRARAGGVVRIILITAALAEHMLRVTLPALLSDAIRHDPEVPVLVALIAPTYFGVRHDEASIIASGKIHLRMRERLRDRVRYFLTLATRPGVEDFEMLNLPASLNFAYRIIRFPRLALKYLSPRA